MVTTPFRSSITLFAIVIGCFCIWVMAVDAKVHVVGKSYGWDIPKDDSFYQNWAKKEKFKVGDELVFMYQPGARDVVEVSKEDFEACTKEHVISEFRKGPAIYKLKTAGEHYFISDIKSQCNLGLKLSISVSHKNATAGDSGSSSLVCSMPVSALSLLLACVLLLFQ